MEDEIEFLVGSSRRFAVHMPRDARLRRRINTRRLLRYGDGEQTTGFTLKASAERAAIRALGTRSSQSGRYVHFRPRVLLRDKASHLLRSRADIEKSVRRIVEREAPDPNRRRILLLKRAQIQNTCPHAVAS